MTRYGKVLGDGKVWQDVVKYGNKWQSMARWQGRVNNEWDCWFMDKLPEMNEIAASWINLHFCQQFKSLKHSEDTKLPPLQLAFFCPKIEDYKYKELFILQGSFYLRKVTIDVPKVAKYLNLSVFSYYASMYGQTSIHLFRGCFKAAP